MEETPTFFEFWGVLAKFSETSNSRTLLKNENNNFKISVTKTLALMSNETIMKPRVNHMERSCENYNYAIMVKGILAVFSKNALFLLILRKKY